MVIDAIVLAGGRSSRLGAVPKTELRFGDLTLLQHAVASVAFARRVVVVGEVTVALPAATLATREIPLFGGPAAGVAAGLDALADADATASDVTVVIACDMPLVSAVTTALRSALAEGLDSDGLIAIDSDERRQPLAAAYRTASLAAAAAEHRRAGRLDGLAMFRLISGLTLTPLAVPAGATDDIDTWDDAARFTISRPSMMEKNG